MGRKVDVDSLVGAAQIAERLGLAGPQVVNTWRRRHPDFPDAVVVFERAHLWVWDDVLKWIQSTGRSVGR